MWRNLIFQFDDKKCHSAFNIQKICFKLLSNIAWYSYVQICNIGTSIETYGKKKITIAIPILPPPSQHRHFHNLLFILCYLWHLFTGGIWGLYGHHTLAYNLDKHIWSNCFNYELSNFCRSWKLVKSQSPKGHYFTHMILDWCKNI